MRWFIACVVGLMIMDAWVLWRHARLAADIGDRLIYVKNATGTMPGVEEEKPDPVLGSALPTEGAGRQVRALEPANKTGYLMVALSSCTSCTKFDSVRWVEDAKVTGVRLLAISGSPQEDIASFRQSTGSAYQVYRDPDLLLHDKLNARWNGRIYYFDASWRLRWMSSVLQSDKHLAGLPDLQLEITHVKARM